MSIYTFTNAGADRARRFSYCWWALLIAAGVAAGIAGAQGMKSGAQDPSMPLVATEITQLRHAVEHSASLHAVAMVLSNRVLMQQQRVDQLEGQEFVIRQQISNTLAEQVSTDGTVNELESRLGTQSDIRTPANSPLVWQWQESLAAARANSARLTAFLQQYRDLQAQLSSARESEQKKLNESISKLNSIYTSMEKILSDSAR